MLIKSGPLEKKNSTNGKWAVILDGEGSSHGTGS
jgi:hypothetical protein